LPWIADQKDSHNGFVRMAKFEDTLLKGKFDVVIGNTDDTAFGVSKAITSLRITGNPGIPEAFGYGQPQTGAIQRISRKTG